MEIFSTDTADLVKAKRRMLIILVLGVFLCGGILIARWLGYIIDNDNVTMVFIWVLLMLTLHAMRPVMKAWVKERDLRRQREREQERDEEAMDS